MAQIGRGLLQDRQVIDREACKNGRGAIAGGSTPAASVIAVKPDNDRSALHE